MPEPRKSDETGGETTPTDPSQQKSGLTNRTDQQTDDQQVAPDDVDPDSPAKE